MNYAPPLQQPQHPLKLPEIVYHLGRFIGHSRWGDRNSIDLFHSLLVCKVWYSALHPRLYEMHLDRTMDHCLAFRYKGLAVEKHRSWVRMMNLTLDPSNWYFPNLEIVTFGWNGLRWATFAPFMARHASHLRSVTLPYMVVDDTLECAALLGRMPKLVELVLTRCCFKPRDTGGNASSMNASLQVILQCQQLRTLDINSQTLLSSLSPTQQALATLPHLTFLRLRNVDANSVATLLPHCPSLKTLSLSIKETIWLYHPSDIDILENQLQVIAQVIQRSCPDVEHIEDLELQRYERDVDVRFLEALVQSVRRLRTFSTSHNYRVRWTQGLLKALVAHRDTLEVIKTPRGWIPPWKQAGHAFVLDHDDAILPSSKLVLVNDEVPGRETTSRSLPPTTTTCSKQDLVVAAFLYRFSRLRIVDRPYVQLEHFGALSPQYCGQAWKCRASLQKLVFQHGQHLAHRSMQRLSKFRHTTDTAPEAEAEEDGREAEEEETAAVAPQQGCLLVGGEGSTTGKHTSAEAQQIRAMMDELARQLELCPRLEVFAVGRLEFKSFH